MKRLCLPILILFSFILTFAHPPSVFAQEDTVDQVTNEFLADFVEEADEDAASNLGSFNVQNINRVSAAMFVSITGGKRVGGTSIKGYDEYYGQGILPATTELTASLYNRPIRTSVYIADVLKNANLIPQAYAQGIGFSGLNPILTIWKAFRNVAYFIFIVIFVIIGFMIMIRKKISNNAVVTLQEALPKIIITLLLITFSYAIAGLLIDLMYLSIFILTGVLQQYELINSASAANNTLFRRNIIGIGISYFTGVTEPAGMAAEAMGALVAQVFGGLIGVVANVIFYLIFAVAVLIAVFRTFIQLMMAYLGIILSTIFAPLTLLPNAFPGSEAFSKWIKGLFANVAVFPVAAAMVLLGAILCTDSTGNQNLGIPITPNPSGFETDGFIPPLLFGAQTDGSASAIKTLIGFGIIMLLPEVVKMTKEALQVKEPAFGEAAWKNAMAGKDKGPVAWLGGGAKWGGNLVTGSLTQAGATIAGRYIRNWGPIAAIQRKAAAGESEHAAELEDMKLEELKRIRQARRAAAGGNVQNNSGKPQSGSTGTPISGA